MILTFMELCPNHETTVWQHNRLAEARYELSTREQKFILYVISMIDASDEEFKSYDINIGQFAKFAGLEKNNLYGQLRELAEGLQSKKLVVPNHIDQQTGSTGVLITNWFCSAFISPNGSGSFSVKLSPDLKPYLLQVKKEFFQFKLHQVMQMRSRYAIRLYQLLKRWQFKGKVTLTISELRISLGAEQQDKSLGAYADFKRRAIAPAVAEIVQKTDIAVSFLEIKTPGSKSIGSITFTILSNSNYPSDNTIALPQLYPFEALPEAKSPQGELFAETKEDTATRFISSVKVKYGLTDRQAKKVLEYHDSKGLDYVLEQMSYVDSRKSKNAAASLLAALRDEWKAPVRIGTSKKKAPPVVKEIPPERNEEIAHQVAASLGAFRKKLMNGNLEEPPQ